MSVRDERNKSTANDTAKVLSSVFDVIFLIAHDGQLVLYDNEQAVFSEIMYVKDIAGEEDAQSILKLIKTAKKQINVKDIRIRITNKNLNIDWADVYIARDDKGGALFLALNDITEGQRRIERLSEAGIFDPLTGAYYRSRLPDILKKIDKKSNLPIAFFMFDVNGMKIVNDIFGYDEGNSLLMKCATILSLAAPPRGIMVRMSGDEFLLMVPKCSAQEREYIKEKVQEYTSEEVSELITPDISIGVGAKESENQDIETALRKTEEKLINVRNRDSASFKNSIVKDLLRHLAMKNFETTKHVIRVKGLALMLGESIGLGQERMKTLSLAADIHDIGKVVIPEEVLGKRGNLTKDDWAQIKRHAVISYSIANALPKYRSTAEAVLYHHEFWDGSGYPEGLKGEEIPLLSRILAIVDAYDIMQNTTHYRPRSFSPKEALNEIKRCAGTQFDPNLVRYFVKIMTP
jgi:diguanylate cyclase (GGDEF)-like protein